MGDSERVLLNCLFLEKEILIIINVVKCGMLFHIVQCFLFEGNGILKISQSIGLFSFLLLFTFIIIINFFFYVNL